MKYISIKEFRDLGYIHEINRLLLHPVGLALEVQIDDEDNYLISGIQDHRDDLEGMAYSENTLSRSKADSVAEIANSRYMARVAALGYWTQPVPNE